MTARRCGAWVAFPQLGIAATAVVARWRPEAILRLACLARLEAPPFLCVETNINVTRITGLLNCGTFLVCVYILRSRQDI
jgi:hypothetical protein